MTEAFTALAMAVLAQNVADPDAPAPATSRSLLAYIKSGGPVGYLLIALSVAAVTLVVLNFIRCRREYWAPPHIVDMLSRMLREHDVEGAKRYCADPANECFVTAVIGAALARCSRSVFGFLELRSALEEAGQVEADRQYRSNDMIGLIAALGPMLGLLGTVIGLVLAFGSLADTEGAARSKELAGSMSLALVNTAQGLAVAIPCTAFYAIFKRKIDGLSVQVAGIVEAIAMPLEQRGGGEQKPAAKAARPTARPVAAEPNRGVAP